jgi:GMP synthase (glutamine-hydrolysing)
MVKSDSDSRRVSTSDDIEVGAYLEIAGRHRILGDSPPLPIKEETILIVDFGSQYSHLIARRVRDVNVYCEIVQIDDDSSKFNQQDIKGIILSGGPNSVYDEGAPLAKSWVYNFGVPILGICYGMQLLAHQLGGTVASGTVREYGHSVILQNGKDESIFKDLDNEIPVWMSHGDRIDELPPGFKSIAYTDNSPIAAMADLKNKMFGIQFHPEVAHTPDGSNIIKNFLFSICGVSGNWTPKNFVSDSITKVKQRVGSGKVICALSGGVDSTVAASIIHKAIGNRLICIFVDNGLMRKGEGERVKNIFAKGLGVKLRYINASNRFVSALKGIIDPEEKRKIIGETFIKIFEEEAEDIGDVDYLVQGTLYPDVIESTSPDTKAARKIKTHHNVGGLPEKMNLKLIEPLRFLFKDEVRKAGSELGLSDQAINRQPFPGPGLAIRIIGEVTHPKLEILRNVDWIVVNEIKKANLYDKTWQSFAVLTDIRTVGVMGDKRTYQYMVALRAVNSTDAMTADWSRLPYDTIASISTRIVNEVSEINRVVYDVTSKPPGTIEWE